MHSKLLAAGEQISHCVAVKCCMPKQVFTLHHSSTSQLSKLVHIEGKQNNVPTFATDVWLAEMYWSFRKHSKMWPCEKQKAIYRAGVKKSCRVKNRSQN